MFPLVARNVSKRVQRRPEWAPVDHADEVELKARPLCAGVSVERTMRLLGDKVDEYLKRVNAPTPWLSPGASYPVASFFMRHI
jgi:hypothetical protein